MTDRKLQLSLQNHAKSGGESETDTGPGAADRVAEAIDRAKERLRDGLERIVGAVEELVAPPPQPVRVRHHGRRRPARRDYRFH